MTLVQLIETAGLFVAACVAIALALSGLVAALSALESTAVLPAVVPTSPKRRGGRPG